MVNRSRLLASCCVCFARPSRAWIPTCAITRKDPMTRLGMALNGGKGKKTQDDFVDFMNEPLPTLVDASDVVCSPEQDDSAPLVRSIASAADKRKGSDIVAMRVSKVTATTSFMVFATGNSRPQNDAIAKSIIDGVIEEHDGRRIKGDGGPEYF